MIGEVGLHCLLTVWGNLQKSRKVLCYVLSFKRWSIYGFKSEKLILGFSTILFEYSVILFRQLQNLVADYLMRMFFYASTKNLTGQIRWNTGDGPIYNMVRYIPNDLLRSQPSEERSIVHKLQQMLK